MFSKLTLAFVALGFAIIVNALPVEQEAAAAPVQEVPAEGQQPVDGANPAKDEKFWPFVPFPASITALFPSSQAPSPTPPPPPPPPPPVIFINPPPASSAPPPPTPRPPPSGGSSAGTGGGASTCGGSSGSSSCASGAGAAAASSG